MQVKDTRRIRRENIGFIFQSHNLIPFLNVLENVTLVPQMNEISKNKADTHAKELLDYLGVGDKLEKMPSQLSGGQSQRVAIARSLAITPNNFSGRAYSSLGLRTGVVGYAAAEKTLYRAGCCDYCRYP